MRWPLEMGENEMAVGDGRLCSNTPGPHRPVALTKCISVNTAVSSAWRWTVTTQYVTTQHVPTRYSTPHGGVV